MEQAVIARLCAAHSNVLVGAALLLAGLGLANQSTADERSWQRARCHDIFNLDDRAITDCTSLIQSGAEAPHELAIDYFFRAMAYTNKYDHERAIADYSDAIRLNPAHQLSYAYRGDAYYAKQDFDHAAADYTALLAFDPPLVTGLIFRGYVHAERGDFAGAVADDTQA